MIELLPRHLPLLHFVDKNMSISQIVEHIRFHSADYLWYLTILVSCLTFILIISIFFESKLLLASPKSTRFLFFESTTSFFLHFHFKTFLFAQNFAFALNEQFRRLQENFRIELIQFDDVHIRQLFEDKNEKIPKKIVVAGLVEFDRLTLTIFNRSTGESSKIQIGKLIGTFRMNLFITDVDYSMEMKFERIQMISIEIIDQLTNVVLSKSCDQHPLIELLRSTICQTIVPCSRREDERIVSNNDVSPPSPPSPPPSASIPRSPTPPVVINDSKILSPIVPHSIETNVEEKLPLKTKFIVGIVKAVKLHDVEQPYCLLRLNEPKQTHQSSLAKNGVNPFWDERFLFDWNEKTNEIHLQIFDRSKNKKKTTDRLIADISIPLMLTPNDSVEQKDFPINPSHPDSIVRLKFAFLPDEDDSAIEQDFPPSASIHDEIVPLPYRQSIDEKDDRVKSSLLCLRFSRDKNPLFDSSKSTIRNFFRRKSQKTNGNFLIDPSTSTPVKKKRSFFRREKISKQQVKQNPIHLSANSLNSYDCSR